MWLNFGILTHSMDALPWPDRRLISAAEGWLELGNLDEAVCELGQVSKSSRNHPAVLDLHWQIDAQRGNWTACVQSAKTMTQVVPEAATSWIHLSYALHELRRTQEAWDNLIAVAERFPENPTLVYNLACYACQLGDIKGAKMRLKEALSLTSEPGKMRKQAMQDPDLTPLFGPDAKGGSAGAV